jgi:putative flippase GtrA
VFFERRFLRFVVAGALNTAFGFSVYAVLVLVRLPVWLALILATVAGIAFNFLTTGGFVFGDLRARRVPRFALAYLGLYLVNLALVEWIAHWTGGPITAQACIVVPLACLTYYVMREFVFRRPENDSSSTH